MTTPVWITGFEHGSLSVNGGGLADSLWGTPGTEIAVGTANARTGTYSLACAPTATTQGRIRKTIAGSPTAAVGRFYIKVTSAPASGYATVAAFATAAGSYPRVAITATDFALYQGSNLVKTGPAYSANTWYRVDWRIDVSANPWQLYAAIDGGTEFSGTRAVAATTITGADLGTDSTTGPAYTAYIDDVIVSATTLDYPIGAGQVDGLLPNADGTHNAGVDTIEDNDGNDIGAVTAYDHINQLPMSESTLYIRQAINGTANYAEAQFADTGDYTAYHGVSGVLAYQSATATANNGGCVICRSDATEITLWGAPGALADYSESSMFYKSAIVTPPGGGWTQAEINALRVRMGYSSDANPDPYWENLLLEVAHSGVASSVTHQGNVVMFGSGQVGAIGRGTKAASATVFGAGQVASIGRITREAGATFYGAGQIASTGRRTRIGAASFNGAGAIDASATKTSRASTSFYGAGQMSSRAMLNLFSAASLYGLGQVESSASKTSRAAASFYGLGALSGTAAQGAIIEAVATLIARGELSPSALKVASAIAEMYGAGFITGTVAGGGLIQAAALLVGLGLINADSLKASMASSSFYGAGQLDASGQRVRLGAADLVGIGELSADALRTIGAASHLEGDSALSILAQLILIGSGSLVGISRIGAGGTVGSQRLGVGTRTVYKPTARGTRAASSRSANDAGSRESSRTGARIIYEPDSRPINKADG